ncbi:cell adhesion molecule DSCAM-like isoform X5 [Convolutriloba macropyga]|uniref:cell adhesion molecule DSCAM-like isoform X5 n=1 Tax=Convolutriloba macropyga TaxID=536237 RepID=UPI003F527A26
MTRNCYATFMLTFFLQLIFYINKSEADQSPSGGRKNHDTTYDITEGGYPMSEVSNGGNSRHYMSSMAPEIISEPQSEIIYQASKGTMLECMTKLTHTQLTWRLGDGFTQVDDVTNLRSILPNSSLQILPFEDSQYTPSLHNTTYHCVAMNPFGSVISSPIHIVPLFGSSVNDWALEVDSVTTQLGSSALFTCRVPEHVQPYVDIVDWLHDLDHNGRWLHMWSAGGRYEFTSSGQLYIRHVTQHDNMQRFKCHAVHRITKVNKYSPAARLQIHAVVEQAPKSYESDLTLAIRTMNARVGDYVKLVCFVRSSLPVSFTWNHGGRTLDATSDILVIQSARVKDNGTYTCSMENELGSDSMQYIVNVEDPLKLTSQSSHVLEAELNKPLVLNCTINGTKLLEFKWYRDATLVQHIPRTSDNLSHLRIPNVQIEDLGIYQCFAHSTSGKSAGGRIQVVLREMKAEITGVFGAKIASPRSQVTLECTAFGSPLPTVNWFKNFKPIYPTNYDFLTDYSSSSSAKDNSPSNSDKMNFRTITMSAYSVKSAITFPKVHLTDSAFYTCKASNKAGQDEYTEKVFVKGGPLIEEMDNKIAVAKRQLLLHCFVAGYPIKQITWVCKHNSSFYDETSKRWYYRNQKLPFNHRQLVHQNGTLEINSVTQEDAGQYECRAEPAQTDPSVSVPQTPMLGTASTTVSVSVAFAPEISPLDLGKRTAGQRFSATCVASVGDPPIQISWYRNGQLIDTNNKYDIKLLSASAMSIISFNSLASYQSGNYTCTAVNSVGSASYTGYLSVLEPPRFQNEPKNSQVVLGKRIEIPCVAVGNPAPKIKWMRQIGESSGRGLEYIEIRDDTDFVTEEPESELRNSEVMLRNRSVDEYVVSASNGSLIIYEADVELQGVYMCQASNGIGSDISKSVTLTVNIPPYFGPSKGELSVTLGSSVVLTCEVFGDKPMSVRWGSFNPSLHALLTEGKIVQTAGQKVTQGQMLSEEDMGRFSREMIGISEPVSSTVSHLTVMNSKRVDTATYYCEASNMYGKSTFNVSLVVLEMPDSPRNLKYSQLKSNSVSFTWEQPFDGNSPLIGYRLNYKPVDDTNYKELLIDPNESELKVENLSPATEYEFHIISETAQGSSEPSRIVKFSTKEAAPDGPPLDFYIQVLSSTAVNVTWKTPAQNNRNGRIIGYDLRYNTSYNDPHSLFHDKTTAPDPNYITTTFRHSGSPLQTQIARIQKLDKFTQYCFQIRAKTHVGPGPYSNMICARTREDESKDAKPAPSQPPSDVEVTQGRDARSLFVSFVGIPIEYAHGVLIGYKIHYSEVGSAEGELGRKLVITKQNQVTIDGLTPFTNYSVSVLGYTSAGDGMSSSDVFAMTSEDKPSSPEAVKVFMKTPSSILVVWTRPNEANGIVTKYKVYCDRYRTQNGVRTVLVSPDRSSLVVDGLLLLDDYKVYVTAFTSAGEGLPTPPLKITINQRIPARIGAFSRNLTSVWKQNVLLSCPVYGTPTPQVWWMKGTGNPADMNPNPTQATLEGGDPAGQLEEKVKVYQNNQSLMIENAQEGDSGVYSCHAQNKFGNDNIVIRLTVLAPPQPPTLILESVSIDDVTVSWKSSRDSQVTSYSVHVLQKISQIDDSLPFDRLSVQGRSSRESFSMVRQIAAPAPERFPIQGLKCGTHYSVYVVAHNQVGFGDKSNMLHVKTVGGAPQAPSKSQLLLSSNATQLTLDLSTYKDHGCPITSFRVKCFPVDQSEAVSRSRRSDNLNNVQSVLVREMVLEGDEKMVTFYRLQPKTWYLVEVLAQNSAGLTKTSYKMATLTLSGDSIDTEGSNAFSGTILMASGAWEFLSKHIVFVALILCSFSLLLLILFSCCCLCSRKNRRTLGVTSKYKAANEYNNTMSSGPATTGTTTHYLTAERKHQTSTNKSSYFGGSTASPDDLVLSDCEQITTPNDLYLQSKSESMSQLQHNLTHNSRQSIAGALTGSSSGMAGSNVILGITPVHMTYDPRASIYSTDFSGIHAATILANPGSNVNLGTTPATHLIDSSQHKLSFGSYGNLQPSDPSELNPLLIRNPNVLDQVSYPNEYSAGPIYNFADDMNGRNIASVGSDRSNSSDASEHNQLSALGKQSINSSTFSTNQKAADLLLLSNELIDSVNNAASVPMKGVVYKYETPNVNTMQTFPNMDSIASPIPHNDDSGIGEYAIGARTDHPDAIGCHGGDDTEVEIGEDSPTSDSSLEGRLVAAERRKQQNTSQTLQHNRLNNGGNKPAAIRAVSRRDSSSELKQSGSTGNFGAINFATMRRGPPNPPAIASPIGAQFYTPANEQIPPLMANSQSSNYFELPGGNGSNQHLGPSSTVVRRTQNGRTANDSSLKCASMDISHVIWSPARYKPVQAQRTEVVEMTQPIFYTPVHVKSKEISQVAHTFLTPVHVWKSQAAVSVVAPPPVPPRDPIAGTTHGNTTAVMFGSTELAFNSQPVLTMGRLPRSHSSNVNGILAQQGRLFSNPNINATCNWPYQTQTAADQQQVAFIDVNQLEGSMELANQSAGSFSQFKSTPVAKMNLKKNTVRSIKRKSSYSMKNYDVGETNS